MEGVGLVLLAFVVLLRLDAGNQLSISDSHAVGHRALLGQARFIIALEAVSLAGLPGMLMGGARFDITRHFDDTIVGLYLKVDSDDSMAGGFVLSIPLTPRRDAMPRGVQVKGPRRWSHSLQTTLNLADGTNSLKPLLLYEPMTDFDLRRDFFDSTASGRSGCAASCRACARPGCSGARTSAPGV